MREPIEIVEHLRNGSTDAEWIKNLYGKDEFTFTLVNPVTKKTTKYVRETNKLSPEESQFLIDNWLDKFDNRPKAENIKGVE